MTHVLALKDSNRAVAIIEDGIASWFMGSILIAILLQYTGIKVETDYLSNKVAVYVR